MLIRISDKSLIRWLKETVTPKMECPFTPSESEIVIYGLYQLRSIETGQEFEVEYKKRKNTKRVFFKLI